MFKKKAKRKVGRLHTKLLALVSKEAKIEKGELIFCYILWYSLTFYNEYIIVL